MLTDPLLSYFVSWVGKGWAHGRKAAESRQRRQLRRAALAA